MSAGGGAREGSARGPSSAARTRKLPLTCSPDEAPPEAAGCSSNLVRARARARVRVRVRVKG